MSRRRSRSREELVFGVATALVAIHALDDAFVHRGPGLGAGQHALAGVLALAAAAGGVVAFPLIEVAAKRHDIAALVTDGAAAGSFEDWHRLRGTDLGLAPGWVMFSTIRVLSGDAPDPPLEGLVGRIAAPTLLVSAGRAEERDFNLLYERAARGRVEHWNLPDAHHTRAIREHAVEYERRVVGFFDEALR